MRGHIPTQTQLTWNPKNDGSSPTSQHTPRWCPEKVFDRVEARLTARNPQSRDRVAGRQTHPYTNKCLIWHESCGRRMQGTWNHGHAHYRCRYPAEYALANHPQINRHQIQQLVDTLGA